MEELQGSDINGSLHLLAGNIKALAQNVRAIDSDLNRVWTIERVERDLRDGPLTELGAEGEEMHELNKTIHQLMADKEQIIFIDLHTTSAQTVPFITMCDTITNRVFVEGLKVPVVIGIEEYLFDPLLSYVVEKGHIALAYESGQHTDPGSVDRHFHFLMLVLNKIGMIRLAEAEIEVHSEHILYSESLNNSVFDVRYRQAMQNDGLTVLPGFSNFDIIRPGQKLAEKQGDFVMSEHACRIFMPLYQSMGADAFFLIGRLPKWWKFLSRNARKFRLDRYIPMIIPGSRRIGEKHLSVLPNIGSSRMKHVLHLVGYRFLRIENDRWIYINRGQ